MGKKLNDLNAAQSAAAIMYSNEPCRVCGEIITLNDINNGAVFAGYSKDNKSRTAHKACWDSGKPQAEWVKQ